MKRGENTGVIQQYCLGKNIKTREIHTQMLLAKRSAILKKIPWLPNLCICQGFVLYNPIHFCKNKQCVVLTHFSMNFQLKKFTQPNSSSVPIPCPGNPSKREEEEVLALLSSSLPNPLPQRAPYPSPPPAPQRVPHPPGSVYLRGEQFIMLVGRYKTIWALRATFLKSADCTKGLSSGPYFVHLFPPKNYDCGVQRALCIDLRAT